MIAFAAFACLYFAVTVAVAADDGPPIEFSAETVNSGPKGQPMTGKMYIGKSGLRREYTQQDKQVIEIINESQHAAWLLFPDEKTYLEQRRDPQKAPAGAKPDPSNPCAGAPDTVTCSNLGVEDVHGRKADKWEIISSHQGRTTRTVQWIDQERHVALKQEFPGGSSEYRMIGKETVNGRETEKWEFTQQRNQKTSRSVQWYDPKLKLAVREELPGGYIRELKNIQEGAQPVSLFELPQGYSKKEMPAQQQKGPGSDQQRER
jgi:hypothetical protein